MSYNQKIKVGFTIGDPTGIGIEVILKTLSNKEILDFFIPIIFGSIQLLNYYKNAIGQKKLFLKEISKEEDALIGKINILNISNEFSFIQFGKPSVQSAKFAWESLEYATNSIQEKKIQVLVTAPINKASFYQKKFNFFGHTEYLERKLNEKSLMLMTSEFLNIGLVTNHLPINKIVSNITEKLIISKLKILNQTLIQDFRIQKPKIAVLGLNPHAGDNSLLGNEEKEIIKPAIEKLFLENKILAFGPFSSDSFFCHEKLKNFHAVLAMYHDQGLIPFKTIAFQEGVNFTAGLSYIRTSPSHGVGYDIAGKGIADETSLKYAIFKALEIYKKRIEYYELRKNPLKSISNKIISNEDEDIIDIENSN